MIRCEASGGSAQSRRYAGFYVCVWAMQRAGAELFVDGR